MFQTQTFLKISLDEARSVIRQVLTEFFAEVRQSSDTVPFRQQRFELDLSVAATATNPKVLNFPMSSIRVEPIPYTTDTTANVNLSLNSGDIQQINNFTKLQANDSIVFKKPVKGIWLTWDAQPSKKIVLVAYVDVEFQSGSQVSITSGSVSVGTGSSMTPQNKFSLLAGTAMQIDGFDPTRKKLSIQNIGGAPVFISGNATVTDDTGATPGIQLLPGDLYEWTNTGPVWGYAKGGPSTVSLNQEV